MRGRLPHVVQRDAEPGERHRLRSHQLHDAQRGQLRARHAAAVLLLVQAAARPRPRRLRLARGLPRGRALPPARHDLQLHHLEGLERRLLLRQPVHRLRPLVPADGRPGAARHDGLSRAARSADVGLDRGHYLVSIGGAHGRRPDHDRRDRHDLRPGPDRLHRPTSPGARATARCRPRPSRSGWSRSRPCRRRPPTTSARRGSATSTSATSCSPRSTRSSSAFQQLKDQGATDLVLDLRYNGGGLVSVAQHLAGLIGGSPLVGRVFVQLRPTTTSRRARTPAYRFESKPQALQVPRLVVIATRGTASASEPIINGLRPYMDVKVVGDTTYGKPVGQVRLRLLRQGALPGRLRGDATRTARRTTSAASPPTAPPATTSTTRSPTHARPRSPRRSA